MGGSSSTFPAGVTEIERCKVDSKIVEVCQCARESCSDLGHIVGSGIVRPALDEVKAMQDFSTSQTKTDI